MQFEDHPILTHTNKAGAGSICIMSEMTPRPIVGDPSKCSVVHGALVFVERNGTPKSRRLSSCSLSKWQLLWAWIINPIYCWSKATYPSIIINIAGDISHEHRPLRATPFRLSDTTGGATNGPLSVTASALSALQVIPLGRCQVPVGL